jgi:cation diffusion facilitator CzcD-associated flavoprotein CzcO
LEEDRPYLVIGAGASGLTMARAFAARGIAFEVVEKHRDIGGLWDIDNPGTPVYETAHFISSKRRSPLRDFPFPDAYPDYPSREQILDYLRAFADTNRLHDHIRFRTLAESVTPQQGGGWAAALRDLEADTVTEERYAGVVSASGNFWSPNLPEVAGAWDGEAYHSQEYERLEQLRGRRVLIVGAGNTGCDLANDAAVAAASATISVRRGYRIIPKHILGRPADEVGAIGPDLPGPVKQRFFNRLIDTLVGDLSRHGWPEPDHDALASHPIVNSRLIDHLAHGKVAVRPDVERLLGDRVRFTDGTEEPFDLIIWATGYRVAFPSLDRELFDWRGENDPDLFLNVFHRERDDLFALGVIETPAGAFPHLSLQAELVAEFGRLLREDPAQAEEFRRLRRARPDLSGGIEHIDSPRHEYYTDDVAYRRYAGGLLEMMRTGHLDADAGVPAGVDWAAHRGRELAGELTGRLRGLVGVVGRRRGR